MRSVYVASKTHNYPRVREVQGLCRQLDLHVTFDWTITVEAVGIDGGLKGQLDDPTRRTAAYNDLEGVRDADLLILLCYPGMCGTLIEFGIAAEREIPIILVGTPERDSVFFELDNVVRCDNVDDLEGILEESFGLVRAQED